MRVVIEASGEDWERLAKEPLVMLPLDEVEVRNELLTETRRVRHVESLSPAVAHDLGLEGRHFAALYLQPKEN